MHLDVWKKTVQHKCIRIINVQLEIFGYLHYLHCLYIICSPDASYQVL